MTNSHNKYFMVSKRLTPETRKSQIIAAADLVLLEVGIDRFTVDQVMERAKIAKGTVYNYYTNKDEMLAELGLKALALMHEYFNKEIEKYDDSIDKIKGICRACYKYYRQYPEYFELISFMERPEFDINVQGLLKISQDFQRYTNSIVIAGQEKGQIKKTLDPAMINYILWASCVGVVQFVETKKKLLKNHHEIDTELMVQTFAEMITEGIKA